MDKDTREWVYIAVTGLAWIGAIALGVRFVLNGLGPGIAASIASYQRTLLASGMPTWLTVTSPVIVNVLFVSATIGVVQKVAQSARQHLFTAIASTLGVLEGSITSVLKHLWSMEEWEMIPIEAALALLFVTAALTWRRPGVTAKLFATVLFLLAPATVLTRAVIMAKHDPHAPLVHLLRGVDGRTWFVLGGIFLLIVSATLAHLAVPEEA
jgi:hypothetical protein